MTTNLPLELLAGMAHELRTPLGAIGGYAELLELGVHGPVTPSQIDGLRRIRHNQQLMVALLNAFMSYAESAAGDVSRNPEALDVHRIAADGVRDAAGRASERRVRIEWQPDGDGDGDSASAARGNESVVLADRDALEALVRELLTDAVESAAPDGTVQIAMRTREGQVSLVLRTSNDPIAESAADAVFDPFSRVAKSNRPSASRHALSLPHARILARSMRGDVVATPDPVDRLVTLHLPVG